MTLSKFPERLDKWTKRRRTLVLAALLALAGSGFAGWSAMKGSTTTNDGVNDNSGIQAKPTVVVGAQHPQKLINPNNYRLSRGGVPNSVPIVPIEPAANGPSGKTSSINSASIYNAGYRDGYNRALNQGSVPASYQPAQSDRFYHTVPAQASTRPITAVRPHVTQPVKDNRTFFQRHPMVKGAAIGAGIGTGAGALTGLVTGQGVFRGAAIGATTGAGVGVIRTSKLMKRHPIVRDIATGGVTGLGLGWAGSHCPHTIAATTGVGSAIGLGVGAFNYLR